ncbi:MAG: ribonuclease Y [Planctomycetota bacterium]
MDWLPYGLGGLVLGGGLVWLYGFLLKADAKSKAKLLLDEGQRQADAAIRDAELKAREVQVNAQAEIERQRSAARDEAHQQNKSLDKRQTQLEQQAEDLKKQEAIVQATQNRLRTKLETATQREKDLNEIFEKQRQQLQRITGLDQAEATKRLLKLLEDELTSEVGEKVQAFERKLKETTEERAREVVLMAMQRCAAHVTAESTTSTVDIPNDEMKGRIIGREGRNIRAFEKETGVDLIIDDTPGVVIVSSFDPVRREVARMSLERLIDDGRIHPSRIEEIVKDSNEEVQELIQRKGKEAVQEVDLHNVHPKLVELLGRLHFRTSYSQNVLRHSIEVAFLSSMMAEMIGLDGTLARRCGLFHDIGKAADHELEGGHPAIGAEILKRHGENKEVVHAALGHHDQILIEHPYTVLVATADACSAARPGSRRESLERYIKRMEELESIALELQGVQQAFAIQAGRELRVLANAKDTDDAKAAKIARDIAKAFEDRLTYPGEIKVTVIRESRFMELAR